MNKNEILQSVIKTDFIKNMKSLFDGMSNEQLEKFIDNSINALGRVVKDDESKVTITITNEVNDFTYKSLISNKGEVKFQSVPIPIPVKSEYGAELENVPGHYIINLFPMNSYTVMDVPKINTMIFSYINKIYNMENDSTTYNLIFNTDNLALSKNLKYIIR